MIRRWLKRQRRIYSGIQSFYAMNLSAVPQYEQVFANAEALKATIEADKAVVENARLQVEYCTIYAPIAGRTGGLLVNQGNLIKANDDKPMVVINQIQPVYVNFSVPEQYLRWGD